MDDISVALMIVALLTLAFIWLRDRLKGEGARHQHAFQRQSSRQTLREGLEEFYTVRGLLPPRTLSAESEAGLRAHDAAHVVFGCDDSTRGEVVLTLWSLFGASDVLPQYDEKLAASSTSDSLEASASWSASPLHRS